MPDRRVDQSMERQQVHGADFARQTVPRLAAAIRANTMLHRRDCLWPSHPAVFGTNPMSLAYGATGIALFLKRAEGTLPAGVETWLLEQPVRHDAYPPGLWVGSSGVAYGMFQIGLHDLAFQAMAACFASPLLLAEASLFYGMAGWGSVSLWLYEQTKLDLYAERALAAADSILACADFDDKGTFWRSALDEHIHYGYAYGASGVGLFLLSVGQALDRPDAVRMAVSAIEYDVAHREEDIYGWTWPQHSGSRRLLAYWAEGAAGVGAVAIRFWQRTGEMRFLKWAMNVASAVSFAWTMLPSLTEGMAGVGEFFVDMYVATGDLQYLDRAFDLAGALSWYLLERPVGILVPGRFFNRASFDLATGSAGIGTFLQRLVVHGPNVLVDFGHLAPAARRDVRIEAR